MTRRIVFKARGGAGYRGGYLPPDGIDKRDRVAARRLAKGHARPRHTIGVRALQDLQAFAIKCASRKEHVSVRSVMIRFGCAAGRATEMIMALLEDKLLSEVSPGLYAPTSMEIAAFGPEKEGDEER